MKGTGYSYGLPEGWTQVTKAFKKKDRHIDSASQGPRDAEGRMDTLTVSVGNEYTYGGLDSLYIELGDRLKAAGHTYVNRFDNSVLDGSKTLRILSHSRPNIDYHDTMTLVAFNGADLVVATLSTNQPFPDLELSIQWRNADWLTTGWRWTPGG